MLRRLRKAFLLASIIVMVGLLLFVYLVVQQDVKGDQGDLKAILNTATSWTGEASSSLNALAYKIAGSAPSLRVTFLLPQGIVLADSGEELPDGKALVQSEAVREALRGGIGESVSWNHLFSPTLNAAAVLGKDQVILHLSYLDRALVDLLSIVIPGFILVAVAFAFSAQLFLRPVTSRLQAQLHQVSDLLQGAIQRDDIDPQAFYPELRPAMVNITRMIDRMRYDLKEVEGAQRMQRDFVDNTSHELKSPLTSILGFAQMLKEEDDLPIERKMDYVGYIEKDAQSMLAVIEDILLLQRHEKQTEEKREAVSLRKVADEVAASLAPQGQEHNLRIHVEGEQVVQASEQDMWDLLRNLMGNAVRYSKPDGRIEVHLGRGRLEVQDDGIGIEPEHLPHIFEKFYRADKSGSRKLGGTGLGLAIVAGIVNKYGANIHVESAPGEGSSFTVTFPSEPKQEKESQ